MNKEYKRGRNLFWGQVALVVCYYSIFLLVYPVASFVALFLITLGSLYMTSKGHTWAKWITVLLLALEASLFSYAAIVLTQKNHTYSLMFFCFAGVFLLFLLLLIFSKVLNRYLDSQK